MSRVHRDVEKSHPLEIDFQNRHVRSQTGGHPRSIDARGSSTDYHDVARKNARNPSKQDSGPATMLGKEIAAYNERHASGDFAHWLQQGKPAIDFHRLVSNCRDAGI